MTPEEYDDLYIEANTTVWRNLSPDESARCREGGMRVFLPYYREEIHRRLAHDPALQEFVSDTFDGLQETLDRVWEEEQARG